MKSLVIALALCGSLMFVRAAPAQTIDEKEEQAVKECNATISVQRNPRVVIGYGIATGQRFTLSHEEQCFLHCFLQKIKFLDENANIRNGTKVMKYTLKQAPELAKYSDVLIATIYQLSKSTSGFEDKCQKALIMYHEFTQSVFTLLVADGLQSTTGVKDKIVNAIEKNQSVDQELAQEVKQFLAFFDFITTGLAQEIATEGQKALIL